MEIGKKLKNARIEAGLTQEKAAEKIDVSRQTISNWENEKSYPDIIPSLTLAETKNGRNPAYNKGCGHFFHGIDMCYFFF